METNIFFVCMGLAFILPTFDFWEFPSEESEQIPEKPVLVVKSRSDQSAGKSCKQESLNQGVCINIKRCSTLMSEFKRIPENENFKNYLRHLWEVCGKTGFDVCCELGQNAENMETLFPEFTNEVPIRLPTPQDGCGYTSTFFKKIVGGEPSKIGAYPWIALLGNLDILSDSPFLCHGTIISARHVLTAAHCLRRGITFVRVGEHDLSRDDETKHEDINITRIERHPDYIRKSGRNDIALLYLQRNIKFSELIAPICLPQAPELRSKSYVKHSPTIAGWGKTSEVGDTSPILLESKISIYDLEICKEKYQKRNLFKTRDQFDVGVICAGDLLGGKDACFGDSGGPLMITESYGQHARFYLIGIVAYSDGCARPDIPGVYTSTQYFMDWIIEKVADSI